MPDQLVSEQPKTEPKRVLFLADFACATGFAQVAHNIVAQLLKTQQYQIDIVGINYNGMPNEWQGLYPTVRLLPATVVGRGDLFGREGYLNLLANGTYDLTFILQDTFVIESIGKHIVDIRNSLKAKGAKVFKWIYYFPIDGTPKENWIRESVCHADYPVVYTQYGYDECIKLVPELASRLNVIAHGTDQKTFRPLDEDLKKEFRKKFFKGRADGKFLVTNLNRNQPRKDIPRTMQIFRLFKDQAPEALLYLHMKESDVGHGLHEVARSFNLIPDEDYIIPKGFDEHTGVPLPVVNGIYNASDIVMTTTLGEGWGLSMTEAMAAKTPVIAPDHTSLTEMLADRRGILIPAGKYINDWVMLTGDNEIKRPLVDIASYVGALMKIRNNPEDAKKKAEVAYEYLLKNWTWDHVGNQWVKLFKKAATPQEKLVVGRNDKCPLCIKEGETNPPKWKRCKLHNTNV